MSKKDALLEELDALLCFIASALDEIDGTSFGKLSKALDDIARDTSNAQRTLKELLREMDL